MKILILKIGELAKKAGVSVRTLHHYNDLGLLVPSERSEKGYRLYSKKDVIRLHQIRMLQELGYSLTQIKKMIDDQSKPLKDLLPLQLEQLGSRIHQLQEMEGKLKSLANVLQDREISNEQCILLLEFMNMYEKYYTPEQLEQLKERGKKIGPDAIKAAEEAWPKLIVEVKAEMEKGTDPSDPKVKKLAARWMDLVKQFTGGDPGIEKSLGNLWKNEGPALAQQYDNMPTQAMSEYINKALGKK